MECLLGKRGFNRPSLHFGLVRGALKERTAKSANSEILLFCALGALGAKGVRRPADLLGCCKGLQLTAQAQPHFEHYSRCAERFVAQLLMVCHISNGSWKPTGLWAIILLVVPLHVCSKVPVQCLGSRDPDLQAAQTSCPDELSNMTSTPQLPFKTPQNTI